jgi:hypothetical protein
VAHPRHAREGEAVDRRQNDVRYEQSERLTILEQIKAAPKIVSVYDLVALLAKNFADRMAKCVIVIDD